MKEPSAAPLFAIWIMPLIEEARKLGYCLAVHGTMNRDLDIVCIPWCDEAKSMSELIEKLTSMFHGSTVDPEPELKPHGRVAYRIDYFGHGYLDVSIMPTIAEGRNEE